MLGYLVPTMCLFPNNCSISLPTCVSFLQPHSFGAALQTNKIYHISLHISPKFLYIKKYTSLYIASVECSCKTISKTLGAPYNDWSQYCYDSTRQHSHPLSPTRQECNQIPQKSYQLKSRSHEHCHIPLWPIRIKGKVQRRNHGRNVDKSKG